MKITAIALLLSLQALSQSPAIRIRKISRQADATWHVTISGNYSGIISKAEILNDPKFTISNNTAGLRIISYEIISIERGKLTSRTNLPGDSISKDLSRYVVLFDKKSKLIFDEIRAVSVANDTIFSESFSFQIT